MKKQFIGEFEEGDIVNSMFAVKFKKPPRKYKNRSKEGEWFELRLTDKTGEITAKYWGDDRAYTNKLYRSFDKGDVIFLRGRIVAYGEGTEIVIDREGARKCSPEEYDNTDFVDVCKKNVDEMLSQLMDIIEGTEEPYKELLLSFFKDGEFVKNFKESPAAMHRHHSYIGGLLEHSLNVARICQRAYELHPELDYSLLVTGAILHDIGKTREFEVGTSIGMSEEGMLLGHITIGVQMLLDRIKQMEDFPERTKLKLTHIILSHHGKGEYGSPRIPQFPEAHIVYFADDMDAKVDYTLRLKNEAETEDLWIWKKDVGHIYLK
ncbi:MAG: HD domain-containing protein [Candidatus Thermoplasmatota archaeon]|nr:HD domain-containing protein [Candidatus Thermoplasmatota archaeon]